MKIPVTWALLIVLVLTVRLSPPLPSFHVARSPRSSRRSIESARSPRSSSSRSAPNLYALPALGTAQIGYFVFLFIEYPLDFFFFVEVDTQFYFSILVHVGVFIIVAPLEAYEAYRLRRARDAGPSGCRSGGDGVGTPPSPPAVLCNTHAQGTTASTGATHG